MESIRIQEWRPDFRQQVIDLIVPIQTTEFSIAITAQQQPDLQDVAGFYQQGKGGFWLALAGDEVVGCIALKDIGNRQGALRKMFVAAGWRGKQHGVALALLTRLLSHAREQEMQAVYLGTTAAFLAAHRFYEKHGFSLIDGDDLPVAFPRMAVDSRFYSLAL
ncbi:GNAT family N-acetyltransferase [Erwinia sp. OLTSP20]|uniref:GNAT family N-acetyltransferase n=1 Tax=unclassified Erwinia TaxID=2622719 RepID=UPI000C1A4456|nr:MULTISPECIES: GNAT family N-acetyltransferase [unclassified Erwinia]PIJ50309.1 GNAT family N-acetyltransferase [Erwinia sp. OAMSP11]PIJ72147.1 GNAT family N-acetyltransferase [Erwinia sp. OLSSP12]PIJ81438.1 GNAT family N-acetyltransferase [Erwinia sp. OLCASP19]PIJ84144.1 GNAT family N-acetyltransferase [Erwinia sp. OLMTSP26]PIJ85843.1 GNAT family N-acetyltransferase [Erwinia sp. OLMDSP33]